MDITHNIDVTIEGNNYEKEYLSKSTPYLFLINYKRISYTMNEESVRKDKNINSITYYEGKLKIVCHLHINNFSIYRELFLIPSLNTRKTKIC